MDEALARTGVRPRVKGGCYPLPLRAVREHPRAEV
jgi:hypothetical protein